LLYKGLHQFDDSLYPEKSVRLSNNEDEEAFHFPWPEDRFQAAEFYILHGRSQIKKFMTEAYSRRTQCKEEKDSLNAEHLWEYRRSGGFRMGNESIRRLSVKPQVVQAS
jgi:hypothetical protein